MIIWGVNAKPYVSAANNQVSLAMENMAEVAVFSVLVRFDRLVVVSFWHYERGSGECNLAVGATTFVVKGF
jgi:hypothetical protein